MSAKKNKRYRANYRNFTDMFDENFGKRKWYQFGIFPLSYFDSSLFMFIKTTLISKIVANPTRQLRKSDFDRRSPANSATVNIPNCFFETFIQRQDQYIFLQNSYFLLEDQIPQNVAGNAHSHRGNAICGVNMRPYRFFEEAKLTTNSNKNLEKLKTFKHYHLFLFCSARPNA